MRIEDRPIAQSERPYIIAEISGNHMGDFHRAMDLVAAAAEAGADAVKLQTYTADTITIACDGPGFRIEDPESLWAGRTLHELYDEAHTPWEWHDALFAEARRLGLHAFSTPFDETAVDFLEARGVPCYKVASFEHTFVPLLEKIAATRKPVIISCGLASLQEIQETHAVVAGTRAGTGSSGICLLACTSSYPAAISDCNLRRIVALRERFPDCEVGLSDHTIGSTAAIAAIALGASVIEKHLTLSAADGAVDGAFSATPEQMRAFVGDLHACWEALGEARFGAASATEQRSEQFRRSIYVVADIAAGEALTPDNIRCIRPGFGMATKHYASVLGQKAVRAISRGTPLEWSMLAARDS